jgi:cell division transport system ATP-binding protein
LEPDRSEELTPTVATRVQSASSGDPRGVDAAPESDRAASAGVRPAAVEFDHVTKTYATGVTALRDVSLRIAPDEFVFIVGPTGTGKSTLMKLIYREETPTSGCVLVNGTDVTRLPGRQVAFLRRRVGVVFQDFKLLPRKTARENVAFALEVTGTPTADVARRVGEVLEVVGLTARADALPGQLSAGEQQRVSIARALVHRPPLLLADEPTGNLDPDTSWEIVQLLSQINLRATTIVVTTHDKMIVDVLRRRVIALEAGAIVRDQRHGLYGGR